MKGEIHITQNRFVKWFNNKRGWYRMIIEFNSKKFFIKEDMGMCFYMENENVFAVPLQKGGEPHDDDGVRTNVDDFDFPQEDIEKLKRMIQMLLQDGPIIAALRKLDNDNKNR